MQLLNIEDLEKLISFYYLLVLPLSHHLHSACNRYYAILSKLLCAYFSKQSTVSKSSKHKKNVIDTLSSTKDVFLILHGILKDIILKLGSYRSGCTPTKEVKTLNPSVRNSYTEFHEKVLTIKSSISYSRDHFELYLLIKRYLFQLKHMLYYEKLIKNHVLSLKQHLCQFDNN